MEDYDIYNEDYSGTIFEDIEDLNVMSFIKENNGEIYDKNDYDYDYNYVEKTNEVYLKKDYYYFMINRLNTLIYVFPNSNMESLYKIAKIEWNNMYNNPDYFLYIFP